MVVRTHGDDRGQMLATGAVVVAITLIAVVTLFNGAVSSGGAGSRTAADAAASAEVHNETVASDMQQLTDRFPEAGNATEFRGNVQSYNEQYNRIHATRTSAWISVRVIGGNTANPRFRFSYESPELSYSNTFEVNKNS